MQTQDLNTMSMSALVGLYNANVSADKRIKKFSDKQTAVKRVKSVLPVVETKAKATTERKSRGPRFVFQPMSEIRPPAAGCARRIAWDLLLRDKGATQAEVGRAVKTKKYPDGLPERQSYECIRLLHYIHGAGLRQDADGRIFLVLPKTKAAQSA